MADTLRYTEHAYGTDNFLQTLGIWEFPDDACSPTAAAAAADSTERGDKYWFIYIHGGAWRDPLCLMDTALPTINRLLSLDSPIPQSRIAGFATINYRLSSHPDFPQDPDRVPAYDLRHAHHPDHIHDVRAALAYLRRLDVGIDSGTYVLTGHSCGAALAFQVLMGDDALRTTAATGTTSPSPAPGRQQPDDGGVPLPAAVVGVEGLYDLDGINERCGGGLQSISEGAYGPDKALWRALAPGLWRGYRGAFGGVVKLAVVAQSPDDELVDMGECDTMERALRESGVRTLAFRDLRGKHDEVREDGRHIARVLGKALEELDRLQK